MGDKSRGLFGKFYISRQDGSSMPGGKHDGCDYFVLDVTHDPLAIAPLRKYAEDARREGYVLLADDLDAMIDRCAAKETNDT